MTNPSFQPLVPNILPTTWFLDEAKLGKERNLWEMWHIYFTHNHKPNQVICFLLHSSAFFYFFFFYFCFSVQNFQILLFKEALSFIKVKVSFMLQAVFLIKENIPFQKSLHTWSRCFINGICLMYTLPHLNQQFIDKM